MKSVFKVFASVCLSPILISCGSQSKSPEGASAQSAVGGDRLTAVWPKHEDFFSYCLASQLGELSAEETKTIDALMEISTEFGGSNSSCTEAYVALETVEDLVLTNSGLTNIRPIGSLKNLKTFVSYGNLFTNISTLATLPKLGAIEIYGAYDTVKCPKSRVVAPIGTSYEIICSIYDLKKTPASLIPVPNGSRRPIESQD